MKTGRNLESGRTIVSRCLARPWLSYREAKTLSSRRGGATGPALSRFRCRNEALSTRDETSVALRFIRWKRFRGGLAGDETLRCIVPTCYSFPPFLFFYVGALLLCSREGST